MLLTHLKNSKNYLLPICSEILFVFNILLKCTNAPPSPLYEGRFSLNSQVIYSSIIKQI